MRTLILPTMGLDPEVFILDENKNVVPAHSVLPRKLHTKKGKYYPDNVALELKINPWECIQTMNREMWSLLWGADSQYLSPSNLKFCAAPALEVPIEVLHSHAETIQFGCEPALVYEAGEVSQTRIRSNPLLLNKRSTGFHIHMGSQHSSSRDILKKPENQLKIVQMCDMLVGLVGVLLDPDPRNLWRREEIGYGRAGEFRNQPHGIEYRTLASWPIISPVWSWLMQASVRDAYILVYHDMLLYSTIDMASVAEAINTNNIALASKLWTEIKSLINNFTASMLPYDFDNMLTSGRCGVLDKTNQTLIDYAISKGGAHSIVGTIEDEWLLGKERYKDIVSPFPIKNTEEETAYLGEGYPLRIHNSWEHELPAPKSKILNPYMASAQKKTYLLNRDDQDFRTFVTNWKVEESYV